MINEYAHPNGKLYCKNAPLVIPNIRRLLDFAKHNSVPVIYINTYDIKEDNPLRDKFGVHAVAESNASKVIDELKPDQNDTIIRKQYYDGFYNTNLEEVLRKFEIENVIVCGIHTHACVLLSALGAFYRGFGVIAVEDCMTTTYKPNHDNALHFYKTHVGELIKLQELFEKFDSR
jgi:nicotinamidase-related amidase